MKQTRDAPVADERELLDSLSHLACQVERQYVATHARYSASTADFELMDRRLIGICDVPLTGLRPIGKFMARIISPTRSTCRWAQRHQEALSLRVVCVSALLRTRVEVEQQHSSQAILAAMKARQGPQLRLQRTVEGFSVVAITYYIIGLLTNLALAADQLGWTTQPELVAAGSIPAVVLLVVAGLWRMRHNIQHP